MAFEENAAPAVSRERYVSLSGYLERARLASQMALLKEYWDNRRGPEAPAARDMDDAAPMMTAEGRWAANWAGNLELLKPREQQAPLVSSVMFNSIMPRLCLGILS
jgi:hypothetical protein